MINVIKIFRKFICGRLFLRWWMYYGRQSKNNLDAFGIYLIPHCPCAIWTVDNSGVNAMSTQEHLLLEAINWEKSCWQELLISKIYYYIIILYFLACRTERKVNTCWCSDLQYIASPIYKMVENWLAKV